MNYTRTPISTALPVTIADAKDYARVTHSEEDLVFARLIKAAALEIEQYTDLALLTQTITVEVDILHVMVLDLPIGPVLSAADVLVELIAADGTTSEIATPYRISAGRYSELHMGDAQTGCLRITYPAGYGATDTSVPADLNHAICDHVLRMYDRRGDEDVKQGLSPASARIAARYRRVAV